MKRGDKMRTIYMYYGLPVLIEKQAGDGIKIMIFDTIFLNSKLYKEVTCYLLKRYGRKALKLFLKKVSNRVYGTPKNYNVIEIYVSAK